MPKNRGKQFEQKFMNDWMVTFPNSFIFRLKDDTSQFKYTAANPCDFICFVKDRLFLIETKTIQGNTFPFSNLSQYDKLLSYSDIDGLVAGVIIWFVDHDRVVFIPVTTVKQMKSTQLKSANIRKGFDGYNVIDIPSVKKRVFLNSDYTILSTLDIDKLK